MIAATGSRGRGRIGGRRPPHGQGRAGFALPLVLAMAAGAVLLVLTSAATTWRAYRSARQAMASARADLTVERAASEAVDEALADSLLGRPLSDTVSGQRTDADGFMLARSAVRTAPFVLWVSVTARDGAPGAPSAVRAVRTRAERLAPPAWPLRSAISATSALDSASAILVGAPTHDVTDCQGEVHAGVPSAMYLPPPAVRAVWATSWAPAVGRAAAWWVDAPTDGRWRVHVIPPSDSVLVGPRQWQGLLLHDGPLRLRGAFTGRGVLVVRGALDASAAQLTVSGAVLVDDPLSHPVRLGSARLQWNRCDVAMALATVATPRSAPFHTWVGLTP